MLRIGLLCLTLTGVLALGCSEPRSVPSVDRIDTSTPEGQFKWAMVKLERAVLEFLPSRTDGLQTGKRTVSYELFPPDDQRENYTAQVTIETETVFVMDSAADAAEEELEEKRRERARRNFEQQVADDDPLKPSEHDPLEDKFLTQMEELSTKSRVPRVPEPILDTPQVNDRKVYDLAYVEGSWQLETKPEKDHERLWFEYALKP